MEIIRDGRLKTEAAVLALGMFDGVHLGHQVLLKKARSLADAAGAPLIVCTFQQHPLALIAPEAAPALLTTFEERSRLLEALGVDYLCAMTFDSELMNMLPEYYVGELVRRFHPTDVVCGYNHRFGQKGAGSPALLGMLGGALGFRTSVVPKITYQGQDVSSSIIRGLLAEGEASRARQMLGRPYRRPATVVSGMAESAEVVMPADGKQTLPPGRYRVLAEGEARALPAVLTLAEPGRGCLSLRPDALPGAVAIAFLSEIH